MLLIPRFLSLTFILFQVPDAYIHHKNKMFKIYPLSPLKISVYAVSLHIFMEYAKPFPISRTCTCLSYYWKDWLSNLHLAMLYYPSGFLGVWLSWHSNINQVFHLLLRFFFTEFIIICHCIFIYVWENCHGHQTFWFLSWMNLGNACFLSQCQA